MNFTASLSDTVMSGSITNLYVLGGAKEKKRDCYFLLPGFKLKSYQ